MTPEEHSFSGGRGRRLCERISVCSRPHLPVLLSSQTCYSERKKTRNLEAYVEWFNRLSYLVATEICMVRQCFFFFFFAYLLAVGPPCWVPACSLSFSLQPVKKKHRARMIEYFIDVARECFNIGNFNSLMAIICEYFCENTGFMGLSKCSH